jgi:dUTP pyrophosphatase
MEKVSRELYLRDYVEMHMLCNDDVRPLYENHEHFHIGDSGLDLYFPTRIEIPPNSLGNIVSLGIKCEALKYCGLKNSRGRTQTQSMNGDLYITNIGYYLYPRSSISKTPLRMSNGVGIIDSGYRGEIKVALDNHSDKSYTIEIGTRLFQLCAPNLSPISLKLVDEISETSRGEGSFGSTGE